MPASGQRRNADPICTALAPSSSAAATPRASPMPPVATTGTSTASATAGINANDPTSRRSACKASKHPRCPPASIPCATITSAPAASAACASATVETFANQAMPARFSLATNSLGKIPITDETIGGLADSRASH